MYHGNKKFVFSVFSEAVSFVVNDIALHLPQWCSFILHVCMDSCDCAQTQYSRVPPYQWYPLYGSSFSLHRGGWQEVRKSLHKFVYQFLEELWKQKEKMCITPYIDI